MLTGEPLGLLFNAGCMPGCALWCMPYGQLLRRPWPSALCCSKSCDSPAFATVGADATSSASRIATNMLMGSFHRKGVTGSVGQVPPDSADDQASAVCASGPVCCTLTVTVDKCPPGFDAQVERPRHGQPAFVHSGRQYPLLSSPRTPRCSVRNNVIR